MLEGLKILSFTHYLQGPSAAQTLADMGADVVKVESPKGAFERHWSGCHTYLNGVSVFFLLANRNQRALSIDLKSPDGVKIIHDLIGTFDIVIENFKPGVMEKLGLDYESLRKVNPKLIYCSCSGHGSEGPRARMPGQDMLAQAVSGFAAQNGSGDRPPAAVSGSPIDQHAAIWAAFGILSAAYSRNRTGEGCKVDCCLLNAAMDLQMEPFIYWMNGGHLTDRATTGLSSRIHQSPYGVYRTQDYFIAISLTPFEKLIAAFGEEALKGWKAEDQMSRRHEFDRVMAAEILKRPTAEWKKLFDELGIWNAPVNDYPQVLEDEQVKYNEIVTEIDHPVAGKVKLVNHANRYNGKPPAIRRLPPELGEHSGEVLRECGYDDAKVAEMLNKGVIAGK